LCGRLQIIYAWHRPSRTELYARRPFCRAGVVSWVHFPKRVAPVPEQKVNNKKNDPEEEILIKIRSFVIFITDWLELV